jgi:hypothetical protein
MTVLWVLLMMASRGLAAPPAYNPAAWNTQKRFVSTGIPSDVFLQVRPHPHGPRCAPGFGSRAA